MILHILDHIDYKNSDVTIIENEVKSYEYQNFKETVKFTKKSNSSNSVIFDEGDMLEAFLN